MSKHTKEPWKAELYKTIHPNTKMYWLNENTSLGTENEADANRIVACVNACAEFDNPEFVIESMKQRLDAFINGAASEYARAAIKASDKLISQRDELLAALKEAREALQFANESPGGGVSDTIWMMHRPETLFDFMDAAIAKAEGSGS